MTAVFGIKQARSRHFLSTNREMRHLTKHGLIPLGGWKLQVEITQKQGEVIYARIKMVRRWSFRQRVN